MWEKPVLLPPWVSDVSQQALLQPFVCVCVCVSEKVCVCVGVCAHMCLLDCVGEFYVWV